MQSCTFEASVTIPTQSSLSAFWKSLSDGMVQEHRCVLGGGGGRTEWEGSGRREGGRSGKGEGSGRGKDGVGGGRAEGGGWSGRGRMEWEGGRRSGRGEQLADGLNYCVSYICRTVQEVMGGVRGRVNGKRV